MPHALTNIAAALMDGPEASLIRGRIKAPFRARCSSHDGGRCVHGQVAVLQVRIQWNDALQSLRPGQRRGGRIVAVAS